MKILYYAIIIVLCFLIGFFFYLNHAVNKKQSAVTVPDIGAIQILNGCGEMGAAGKIGDFLRTRGFDVKEITNAPDWNYRETIVVSRIGNPRIAQMVAKALNTENLILLRNKSKMFDVSVFVGKDYLELTQKSE
jgi:hypothetical protein